MKTTKTILAGLALAAAVSAVPALAHESHGGTKQAAPLRKEQQAWGIAGERKDVSRTIRIAMTDDMRFTPAAIEVRQGETIRFLVANDGKVLHEMVIGDRKTLDEHAALMQKFPSMEHDEPHMAHVAAGKRGELVWTFNRPGEFDFACLIPGHYQAGMTGKIKVISSKEKRK